jgi:phage/plasmid-associated DNA primase
MIVGYRAATKLQHFRDTTGKLEPGHVKADPKLVSKLTSDPIKMSGILNWILQGLARLERQQGYSIKLSPEENRLRYDAMAAPLGEIGNFLDTICEFARDYSKETRKADLYLLYNTYLQARKVPGVTNTTFNEALVNAGIDPQHRNTKADPPVIALDDSNAKKPYTLKGLVLKKNWKDIYKGWLELISISQNKTKIGV